MASALKQSSAVEKQRATDDEVERAKQILSGSFKSIDIAARTPVQVARLRSLLSLLSITNASATPEPSSPTTVVVDHHPVYELDKRLAEIKEAETEATQNLFDYLGTTDVYWEAHVWFVDYHLRCKARIRKKRTHYYCTSVLWRFLTGYLINTDVFTAGVRRVVNYTKRPASFSNDFRSLEYDVFYKKSVAAGKVPGSKVMRAGADFRGIYHFEGGHRSAVKNQLEKTKQELDSTKKERDAAKKDYEAVKEDRDIVREKLEAAEKDREAAEKDRKAAQTELKELKSLKRKLASLLE